MSRVVGLSIISLLAFGLAGCASTSMQQKNSEPAETASAPKTSMQGEARNNDSYLVQDGDSLWTIASQQLVYGDPYRWPLLYKANQTHIEDADLIEPGQLLVIRRDWTRAEVDAAIEHARTRGSWQVGVVEQSDRDYLANGVALWDN